MSSHKRKGDRDSRSSYDDHPQAFLQWLGDMESAEMNVHPEDRVYLVVSRLQRVRKARKKLGFLENVSATVSGLAGGSMNATKAVSSSTVQSFGSSNRQPGNDYDVIGQDIKEAWLNLASFFTSHHHVQERRRVKQTRSYSPHRESRDNSPRRERSASRTSRSGYTDTSQRPVSPQSSARTHGHRPDNYSEGNFVDDNLLMTDASTPWRTSLGLTAVPDWHKQDQLYWAKQRKRHYGGSTSSFELPTKGIAQCHWAIEYRGRYFELQVRKLPHAYQLKEFAFFNSTSEVAVDQRDIIARAYAGCSHMSCEVMNEIGKGIMKTQPVYELRSDNCQQFVAVFLPRILCSRHPYMPSLPYGNVPWAQKYTTFPSYVVGIRQGELTAIDHRYYTVTSGLNMLVKQFDKMKGHVYKDLLGAWRGKPQIDFQSTEISKYTFRLQGDDPGAFLNCKPVWHNPYLLIHREHKKTDIRPLGNHESIDNDFHLWPISRPLYKNPLLDQLEQAAAIQNGKKLRGSLDLFKTQIWRDITAQAEAQSQSTQGTQGE